MRETRGGLFYKKSIWNYGIETPQKVEKVFISEGDLFRLIVKSKLPGAERFERWIFDEVLPAIRKQARLAKTVKEVRLIYNTIVIRNE